MSADFVLPPIDPKWKSALDGIERRAQRMGQRYGGSLRRVTILNDKGKPTRSLPFSSDFQVYADRCAHAIRRHVKYRSDDAQFARGLVRHAETLRQTHAWYTREGWNEGMPCRLKVGLVRRQANDPAQRAVMFVMFGPLELKDKASAPWFDFDPDIVPDNPDMDGRNRRGLEAMLDAAEQGISTIGDVIFRRESQALIDWIQSIEHLQRQNLRYVSSAMLRKYVHPLGRIRPSRDELLTATDERRILHGQLPSDGQWPVFFIRNWERQYQSADEKTLSTPAMQRQAALSVLGAINEMHFGLNMLAKYVKRPDRDTSEDNTHEYIINKLTELLDNLRSERPPYPTPYQVIRVTGS